ncbi:MAG: hypothetical protein CMJ74_12410 [Planctomycetaceae bacterium]|nr:hypothetical protein [Planctomycetaceae bacterium]|tara:strand:- start:918 stop:1127 length:210 start_codon:yes stop_codon:yes gene_type:complete
MGLALRRKPADGRKQFISTGQTRIDLSSKTRKDLNIDLSTGDHELSTIRLGNKDWMVGTEAMLLMTGQR